MRVHVPLLLVFAVLNNTTASAVIVFVPFACNVLTVLAL